MPILKKIDDTHPFFFTEEDMNTTIHWFTNQIKKVDIKDITFPTTHMKHATKITTKIKLAIADLLGVKAWRIKIVAS